MKIYPSKISGEITAVSSKSEFHRHLILSALCKEYNEIEYSGELCDDVKATINCLKAVGCKIDVKGNKCYILPPNNFVDHATINCGESASTLRFLVPVFCALGISFTVLTGNGLSHRNSEPLYRVLRENDITICGSTITGKFKKGDFVVDGDVSSQWASGILMALPLIGGSLQINNPTSIQYLDLTIKTMKQYGVDVAYKDNKYIVAKQDYTSTKKVCVGGDWSAISNIVALGVLGGSTTTFIRGAGADSNYVDIIKSMGADVLSSDNSITTYKSKLNAITFDAKHNPDLVPIVSVLASVASGTTTIINVERLRNKESDRVKTTVDMVNNLGGKAKFIDGTIAIDGVDCLTGGKVDTSQDHRIIMASAVASAVCKNYVEIDGDGVSKSYPQFFDDIIKLGVKVELV